MATFDFDACSFDALMSSVLLGPGGWDEPSPSGDTPQPSGGAGPSLLLPPPSHGLLVPSPLAPAPPPLAVTGAQPPPRDAPPVAGHLRCLDASHPGATCAVCHPPPEEGDDDFYELVGEQGKKNGEKLLRAQLAKCAEWKDDAARLSLSNALAARAGDGGGCKRLVSCLRGNDTMAALRKSDLIMLARAWNYKSTFWRRRRACSRATQRVIEGRGAKAAAAAGGAAPPPAQHPRAPGGGGGGAGASHTLALPAVPPPPLATQHGRFPSPPPPPPPSLEPFDDDRTNAEAVRSYVEGRVRPLLCAALRGYRGEESRDAAARHGWAHLSPRACEEVLKSGASLQAQLERTRAAAPAAAAARAALPPTERAWLSLTRGSGPADALVEGLRVLGGVLQRCG